MDSPSVTYIKEAIQTLPQGLAQALHAALPALPRPAESIVTTGVGASEGPARLLAWTLAERGLAARFCPISRFATDAPGGDLLVLFSQGLSPNGRLALSGSAGFRSRWLVTSVGPDSPRVDKRELLASFTAQGFVPMVIPPASESGTLVRVIGPTVASLAALRLAAQLLSDAALHDRLREAPKAYEAAGSLVGPPSQRQGGVASEERSQGQRGLRVDWPLALVTAGLAPECVHAHRWKLLEALLVCDPSVWDVLQFAHGPLQTIHNQTLTLLVLERGHGSPLVERFTQTLNPAHHHLVHLMSERVDELAFFEHAAQIDALLLATLQRHPRDLYHWPAQHDDAPLYGLGGPSES